MAMASCGPGRWNGRAKGAEPRILMVPRDGDPALGAGDRILARVTEVSRRTVARYDGRLIRRIGASPSKVLGVFRKTAEGGRIVPVDKGADREWLVPPGATLQAKDGELVEAEGRQARAARMGLPAARIVTRLGDPSGPRAVSLIAIHQFGIPDDFRPSGALAEAEAAQEPGPEGREDLTRPSPA
jgi:ribonuclease R